MVYSQFEIVYSQFEIDYSQFEIDYSQFEVDQSQFEVEKVQPKANRVTVSRSHPDIGIGPRQASTTRQDLNGEEDPGIRGPSDRSADPPMAKDPQRHDQNAVPADARRRALHAPDPRLLPHPQRHGKDLHAGAEPAERTAQLRRQVLERRSARDQRPRGVRPGRGEALRLRRLLPAGAPAPDAPLAGSRPVRHHAHRGGRVQERGRQVERSGGGGRGRRDAAEGEADLLRHHLRHGHGHPGEAPGRGRRGGGALRRRVQGRLSGNREVRRRGRRRLQEGRLRGDDRAQEEVLAAHQRRGEVWRSE